jgi:hypothetical protein
MPRRVATLVINCVSSLENRVLFRDIIYAKDIVILLTQEVATYCIDDILGYVKHYDNSIEKKNCTAFFVRNGIIFTDIKRHPTGRTMVEWIASNSPPERENFFNYLTPNGHFSGRTAPVTYRCRIFLFIQHIHVLNILNMLHTLRFFLLKMSFIS